MVVEDLAVAAETLRNAVSAALLGEHPQWLYDFRREGEERVRQWSPPLLAGLRGAIEEQQDEEEDFPVLRSLAEDLVEQAARRRLPPVIGDEPDLTPYHDKLQRFPPPSLLLLGEPGVGKSTWVRRVARLIVRWKRDGTAELLPRIWRTSADRILAGMIYLGMWQKRCFDLLEELSYEGDYLYVDHLSGLVRRQPDGLSISDLLTPAVISGEISLLAECTAAELAHCRRLAPALVDHLELVRIAETPAGRVPEMMAAHAERAKLKLHPEALRRLVQYLELFEPATRFPGKGFRLLDWLEQQGLGSGTLYPRQAADLYSAYSGLPVSLIADDQPLTTEQLAQELSQRVVGQDRACQICGGVLARFKARLNDPGRPLGTLLFVGPTGVGKTELAKQLARTLFGDAGRMLRLDMSEYQAPGSADRLLQAGQHAGSLSQRMRQQPLTLVLLDEIEKAHPQVFDLLLGVLGEGRMTDTLGRLVDFRMALIVMTSNLGATKGPRPGFSTDGDRVGPDFIGEVKRHFRPELINRLDHVVPFGRLDPGHLLRIVDLELAQAEKRPGLQRRGIRLQVSTEARAALARLGHHPDRGARPLKRVIEERVITPLAVRLAEHPDLPPGPVQVLLQGEPAWEHLSATERQRAMELRST
jgi:ATP-dependent Clp protease ATP-binding subunit ClpC